MPDRLEQNLREALAHRAAQLDPDSITRLRAIDYHPRRRRIRKLPAIGALGAVGAATVTALVTVGSSAGPAFAGWQAKPSTPTPGQLAQAEQACGQGLGNPVLTDSRGPYTAAVYADSTSSDVCLSGNGVSMSSSSTLGAGGPGPGAGGPVPDRSAAPAGVAAGQIELAGGGTRDSAGNALTLVDGRTGAGVTAVTIERSDGSSVQATVADGWYLAWWPGTLAARKADVTTTSGTSTLAFPSTPTLAAPVCPSGTHCAYGYGFGSAGGPHSAEQSSTAGHVGSVSGSASSSGSARGAVPTQPIHANSPE